MNHYTDDQWLDFAGGFVGADERSAMEAHLLACGECRTVVADVEDFEGALGHPDAWLVCDAALEPELDIPEALQQLANRIERERRDAEARLEHALVSPVAFAEAAVEERDEHYTSGTVELLTAAARRVRYQQPTFALTLATAATTIGSRLARENALRSAALLTYAWAEKAAALFFCGRYRDADRALVAAQAVIERDDDPATAFDTAIIGLLRATIYSETDRAKEAVALANSSEVQFAEFGDERNAIGAKLIAGNVAFFARNFAEALAIDEQLIRRARESSEMIALAHALASAGGACVRLKRYSEAEEYLLEVIPLWDELGYTTNRLRAEWVLAISRIDQGDYEAGMPILERAIRELEALGASNDAAVPRLYLAEALWLAGRVDEIPSVIEPIVVTFAAEGMTWRANYAVAFLRDALSAGRANVAIIRHVRDYLHELPRQPTSDFRPPQHDRP
jgi:tetratricopeptide (TPR) repeat protein